MGIEKDKSNLLHEISDVRAATEEIGRSKASAEKSNKGLLGSLNDANKKVEEANLTLGDFENNKRKIAAENADLLRQLQELENQANMLSKLKKPRQRLLLTLRIWLPKLTRLNFSMPPWRRRPSNLTNLSMNGNSKPNLPPWTLTPHKRNAEMPPLSSSESSLPMKNPSSNWMMFARRIRS